MKQSIKPRISAKKSIITSIVVSIGDIVINLTLALITNSTVMLSQALQGFADLTTTGLLLVGVHRSNKKADKIHPFGFGREIFFWTLLASIFAFVVTGLYAVMQGIEKIKDQIPLHYSGLALMALLFGLCTNAYSMHVSLTRLGADIKKVTTINLIKRIYSSSLVETKTTLLVDFMGTVSAAIGIFSISLYISSGEVLFDGLGAILVGIMTMTGAAFLIFNLKDFIIGKSPRQEVVLKIRKAALSVNGVIDILDLRAVTIGSNKYLVIIEVHFEDDLTTDKIEKITDKIKLKVRKSSPSVELVQVEAETPDLEDVSLDN